jgi:hypothetical protein
LTSNIFEDVIVGNDLISSFSIYREKKFDCLLFRIFYIV